MKELAQIFLYRLLQKQIHSSSRKSANWRPLCRPSAEGLSWQGSAGNQIITSSNVDQEISIFSAMGTYLKA